MDKKVTRKHDLTKPVPMWKLIPEIRAILPERHAWGSPAFTKCATTSGKVYKPMKLSEMVKHRNALNAPAPKIEIENTASNKKKQYSTIRVDKARSSFRKVLDSQLKAQFFAPKAAGPSETPKLSKREFKGSKLNLKKAPPVVQSAPVNPSAIKREQSDIESIKQPDLRKATVEKVEKDTVLDELWSVAKRLEQNLTKVEGSLKVLNEVRESDMQSLELVRKLIITASEHKLPQDQTDTDNKISETNDEDDVKPVIIQESADDSQGTSASCSEIKPCATSYKIHKTGILKLKRKATTKPFPNKLNETRNKGMSEHALKMYMEMKRRLSFLKTPTRRHQSTTEPDSPTATSHNVQLQLEKLYGEC